MRVPPGSRRYSTAPKLGALEDGLRDHLRVGPDPVAPLSVRQHWLSQIWFQFGEAKKLQVAWRRLHRGLVARAGAGRGADAAAATFPRGYSVGDSTGAYWASFSRYCLRRGRCALPATTTTVTEFIGWQWRPASVKAVSLKPMLAAVRKAHLAAGLPNPCDDSRVREAKAGFRRADLEIRPSRDLVRVPLPAKVVWSLARRALDAAPTRRRRLTALVCQFWWLRRASDVARLNVGEVEARADGTTHYVVPRHKTEAVRGLLARSVPPPGRRTAAPAASQTSPAPSSAGCFSTSPAGRPPPGCSRPVRRRMPRRCLLGGC